MGDPVPFSAAGWFIICYNDGCSWINGKIQNNFQVDAKIRLSPTHRIKNIFYYDYFTGGRSPDD